MILGGAVFCVLDLKKIKICQDLKLVALSISSSRLKWQKTRSFELKNPMV